MQKQRLLILPGHSIKNKQWTEDAASQFWPQIEAKIWTWKHWESGELADFSPQSEVSAILTHVREFKGQKVSVLAKSIGTWILANVVKQSTDAFDNMCLCGIPLNDLEKNEWLDYKNFKNTKAKMICFQNDEDPHGNFAQVSNFFESEQISIPLVKKLADNHDYRYFEEFSSFFSC